MSLICGTPCKHWRRLSTSHSGCTSTMDLSFDGSFSCCVLPCCGCRLCCALELLHQASYESRVGGFGRWLIAVGSPEASLLRKLCTKIENHTLDGGQPSHHLHAVVITIITWFCPAGRRSCMAKECGEDASIRREGRFVLNPRSITEYIALQSIDSTCLVLYRFLALHWNYTGSMSTCHLMSLTRASGY